MTRIWHSIWVWKPLPYKAQNTFWHNVTSMPFIFVMPGICSQSPKFLSLEAWVFPGITVEHHCPKSLILFFPQGRIPSTRCLIVIFPPELPVLFMCNTWPTQTIKNIKMRSFKSSENILKKEGGPDRSVSDNQSSPVALNELTAKARKIL